MKDIKEQLIKRKKQLQKECWSNKIRIDEINRIIDLITNLEAKDKLPIYIISNTAPKLDNF